MFKFYRSVLAAGAIAMGLAACGDDVTVGGTNGRGVTSVVPSPSNASVGVGQSIALSALVTADSGLATTVTWTSSNVAIATVTSTGGIVTGVSVGTTTIVARSTADTTKSAAVQLTVVANQTGITSFTIAPANMTLAPGQASQATPLFTKSDSTIATPTVTWASLSPAIATVSTTGLITGVTQGSAVVTGTIPSGQVATVNVTVGAGASISIASVTVGGTNGVPVNVTNVFGQIDVNMNLNAGVQPLDSLTVSIKQGTRVRRVDAQSFVTNGVATIPAAGPITLSISSNRFTKNPTTGIALPDIFNGPASLIVQVFPHNTAGGQAVNCQTGANDPTCAGISSLTFNNTDGFAADITKPSVAAVPATPAGGFASDVSGNANALGQTYVGGPTPTGQTTVELYAVIYNDNPNNPAGSTLNRCNNTAGDGTGCMKSVTWSIGTPAANVNPNLPTTTLAGCFVGTGVNAVFATQTTLPFKQVFGNGTGATAACSNYQNVTTSRDNVLVTNSIDGSSNPFITIGQLTGVAPVAAGTAPYLTLIPNVVASGGTPDSVRVDYVPPAVTAPTILGAEGQNWINANFNVKPAGTIVSDGGVGGAAATWKASFALGTSPVSGGIPTQLTAFTTNTGADLPETNTNTSDGFEAISFAADLLGNTGNSSINGLFGVDKTAPLIRYDTTVAISHLPGIFASEGLGLDSNSTPTYFAAEGLYGTGTGHIASGDTTAFVGTAAGNNDSIRVETIDGRSGPFRVVATVNRFSQAGSASVGGYNQTAATPGTFLPATVDGWIPVKAVNVVGTQTPTPPAGYYTTTMYVVDKAGNISGCPTVGTATSGVNSFVVSGSICLGAAVGPSAASTTAGSNPGLGNVGAGAGTNANLFIRRTLAIDPGPPSITGVSPNASYVGNAPQTFILGAQSDLEVIDSRLRIQYPNLTTGTTAGTIPAAGGLVWTYALSNTIPSSSPNGNTFAGPASGTGANLGYFVPIAIRFDASIVNPIVTGSAGVPNMTLDQFTLNVQETCTAVPAAASAPAGPATGPTTAAACGGASAPAVGDPIPFTGAGSIALAKPTNIGVQVRDVFGSWIFNFTAGATTGVSTEFVSPILSATVAAPGGYSVSYFNAGSTTSCPQGGRAQAANTTTCVNGGINFRADSFYSTSSTKVFRATEPFSNSLPVFTRVDLFGLNALNQWVFITRITVPNPVSVQSACPTTAPSTVGVVGCDNTNERYWLYTFPSVPAGFSAYRAIGVNSSGFGLASTVY